MNRAELIESILEQMQRVRGDEGFAGTFPEYALLRTGITEEEDVQWQFVSSTTWTTCRRRTGGMRRSCNSSKTAEVLPFLRTLLRNISKRHCDIPAQG